MYKTQTKNTERKEKRLRFIYINTVPLRPTGYVGHTPSVMVPN